MVLKKCVKMVLITYKNKMKKIKKQNKKYFVFFIVISFNI